MYEMNFNARSEDLDAFVEHTEGGSILQESKWALVKDNWDHAYITCAKDGKIAASAMVLMRRLIGPYKLFYIPRGPVMDYSDRELVNYFLAELKKWAKKNGAVTLRFDPLVVHDVRSGSDDPADTQVLDDVTNGYEPKSMSSIVPWAPSQRMVLPSRSRLATKCSLSTNLNCFMYSIPSRHAFSRGARSYSKFRLLRVRSWAARAAA